MEEAVKQKGTVTPISSLFSPEETLKASKQVQDTISDRREQLDVLKGFIADNSNLINLVQTLPNELQHQIMVPFGKAAFFPGRLIHTNEFMVLLGDGYYAERTSKQTVEILKRRQKVLESQVESVKADIQDLKTEASFFDSTADEAASGLVQIVEEYSEERPFHEASNAGGFPSSSEAAQEATENEDDEYERIFARIAELEKEEEAAGNDDDNKLNEDDFDDNVNQLSADQEVISSRVDNSKRLPVYQDAGAPASNKLSSIKNDLELPDFLDSDVSSHAGAPASNKLSSIKNDLELPEVKQNVEYPAVARHEAFVHTSQQSSNSSKAFTSSIVEHTHNLETNPWQATVARNSKPVSRFRMNRKK